MKDLARRLNFFSSSFIAILGLSLASEIFQEDDAQDKVDDFLMLVLSGVVIWWYKLYGYKAEKATMSVILIVIGLLIKIGAIIVEHGDKEAVGDDIGIAVGLVLALIFVSWQVFFTKKQK